MKLMKTKENESLFKAGNDKTQIAYQETAFRRAAGFLTTGEPRGVESERRRLRKVTVNLELSETLSTMVIKYRHGQKLSIYPQISKL